MKTCSISALICTMDRPGQLKTCVDSILNQNLLPAEIIIVDQSDEYNLEIASLSNVKYFQISKRGLSHARNIGLSYVSCLYVSLIDDDAIYPRNYYSVAYREILENCLDIISGQIKDPNTKVTMNGMGNESEIITNTIKALGKTPSASLVIKTDLLKEIKFDERFGVGSRWGAGEETDVVWQFLYLRKKIKYVPELVVYHKVLPASDIPLEKLEKYNYGTGALFAKHIFHFNNYLLLVVLFGWCAKHYLLSLKYSKSNRSLAQYYRISCVSKIRGFFHI